MRTALSTTPIRGRHRLGRPGLVPVTAFVTIIRRSLFAAWRTPGRHRHIRPVTAPLRRPEPVPAI